MTRPAGIRSTTSRTSSAYGGGSSPPVAVTISSVRRQAGVDVLHPGEHPAVDVRRVRVSGGAEQTQALRRADARSAVQNDSLVEWQLLPRITVVEGGLRYGDGTRDGHDLA